MKVRWIEDLFGEFYLFVEVEVFVVDKGFGFLNR